jgi:hypothetical protein
VPPARDLELEALGEILQGKRFIHCHSYRQDEILMFIRQMQSFGVQIAAMHHVLEGYKVADEMAAAASADRAFRIGGPTSSRCMTPSLTTARSCTIAACWFPSIPIRTTWRGG